MLATPLSLSRGCGRLRLERPRLPDDPRAVYRSAEVARLALMAIRCCTQGRYGTEGQRFESSLARSPNPFAVGDLRLVANAAGWQHRGQRGNSEHVAPGADWCAGHLSAWFEVRGCRSRRGSSAQAGRGHAGRGCRVRSSWCAMARRGHCGGARRCTSSACRGLIATPALGMTACAPTRAASTVACCQFRADLFRPRDPCSRFGPCRGPALR